MANTKIRLIMFLEAQDRDTPQLSKTRPEAVCGSDHQFLIAKFRLKLQKVGKTSRPFRQDLNQILYAYIVEVTNRFKGLDMVDRVPDELWMDVHKIVWEVVTKIIPKKKKCQGAKWLSEEDLQIVEERRKVKGKRERETYPTECRVLGNSKERKERLLK